VATAAKLPLASPLVDCAPLRCATTAWLLLRGTDHTYDCIACSWTTMVWPR